MAEVLLAQGKLFSNQSADVQATSSVRQALAIEEQIKPPDQSILLRCRTTLAHSMTTTQPKDASAMMLALLKEPAIAGNANAYNNKEEDLSVAYINLGEYSTAKPFAERALA